MAYATISKPSLHNNSVLYTGDETTHAITGVGFQPDLWWNKSRSGTHSGGVHCLFDSVRGATKRLQSNSSDAEATISGVTAFDSDGVTLGSENQSNGASTEYVGWNWKAGTTTGITQGSATITPSAYSFNTTAGFSIIKFTTPGSSTGTVPHGLGVAPKVIIGRITGSSSWQCGFDALQSGAWTSILSFNNSAAEATGNAAFGDTPPDSTLFTMNSANWGASQDAIAYCFSEVKGYSRFGSYTGNNNADGTFVYTGFKPSFIIVKKTNGADNWFVLDNKRNTYNVEDKYLLPDATGAEATYTFFDFISTGFKIRSTGGGHNGNGDSYIYMAFAENPLVANVGESIPATAR